MLAAAILYVLTAYNESVPPGIDERRYALCVCAEHMDDELYPSGYGLVGEACDYIKDPYLPEVPDDTTN